MLEVVPFTCHINVFVKWEGSAAHLHAYQGVIKEPTMDALTGNSYGVKPLGIWSLFQIYIYGKGSEIILS